MDRWGEEEERRMDVRDERIRMADVKLAGGDFLFRGYFEGAGGKEGDGGRLEQDQAQTI